ncbi:hypothetical protein N657DRAFT_655585 [Parathielavia appendiculata]|uniref:Uncharacterized protein n=1 Tax=Parathielavia appendiculata TaxID=2587402 RepID=A0AAN6Z495_9PEZI|nr:hypothetical protein N657DRAFT_655585 [Parathielavia appendiculata]
MTSLTSHRASCGLRRTSWSSAPPGCTLDICAVEISVYGYRPSLAANITFISMYTIAPVIQAYLRIRWKQWWYVSLMMYYNPFSFAAFVIQIICVTTEPVYYFAAIYITLAHGAQLFYYIFIPCDILSLVLQAAGGALSTTRADSNQVSVNFALAGLAFPVFTSGTMTAMIVTPGKAVRLRLFFGFKALAIIPTLARCAYRLAELHEGYQGKLIRDEALFIGLEGV